MTVDAARKRDLLGTWLSAHSGFRVPLHDGGPLDARMTIATLRRALPDPRESVYLLVSRDTPLVPLYIGRARVRPLGHELRRIARPVRGAGQ